MRIDLDNLPVDPSLLHSLVRDMVAAVEQRDGEIERLKSVIKQLQRAQFGRRSERLDTDQLALAVLAWRLSNTIDSGFCVEALEEALARHGKPRIFNTDQGAQFTSAAFRRITARSSAAGMGLRR
jgi:transposase InsO family protein